MDCRRVDHVGALATRGPAPSRSVASFLNAPGRAWDLQSKRQQRELIAAGIEDLERILGSTGGQDVLQTLGPAGLGDDVEALAGPRFLGQVVEELLVVGVLERRPGVRALRPDLVAAPEVLAAPVQLPGDQPI